METGGRAATEGVSFHHPPQGATELCPVGAAALDPVDTLERAHPEVHGAGALYT